MFLPSIALKLLLRGFLKMRLQNVAENAPVWKPLTYRASLRQMPALHEERLWPAQFKAITNLEKSLAVDRPRSLVQMATGSGKTFTAVYFIYR